MANSKERDKRRAARLRKNEALKKASMELAELIEDEVPDELPVEVEEKEGGPYAVMENVQMPVTSFQELDALKTAQKQAAIVREVTYEVQDLARNILYTSDMSPKQKTSAMKAVADEFGNRVQSEASAEMSEKSLDMELLQIQAIIAKDRRHTPIAEKLGDFISNTFSAPLPHSKTYIRKELKEAAELLEKGDKEILTHIPGILKSAKDAGVGRADDGILIEKDASGSWRWVGYPTNNFIDSSHDIITETAHIDYVNWINENIQKNAPVFTSCHAPGTVRENPVDFAGYENGFVVMSGKLAEGEAAALLKASAQCDIGMSHTGWALRGSLDPRQITKYRSFEITDMPIEMADNPFTFMELSKEVDMNQLEYLTTLLGSREKAEEALKLKTSMKQKELQDAGVESKEKETVAETTPEAKPETKPADTLKIEDVIKRVSKELGMEELSEQFEKLKEAAQKVEILEGVVKELSKNRDEELAEMIQPKMQKGLSWMSGRASQKTETVLTDSKEDEKLKKAKPETGWLSEISGTTPLQ